MCQRPFDHKKAKSKLKREQKTYERIWEYVPINKQSLELQTPIENETEETEQRDELATTPAVDVAFTTIAAEPRPVTSGMSVCGSTSTILYSKGATPVKATVTDKAGRVRLCG